MTWRGDDESFESMVNRKRIARMEKIDKLPPEIRTLVNEYGFHVVNTLMDFGVTKPGSIKHVVEIILDEFSPTRGSFSKQGVRTEVIYPEPEANP